MILGVKASDTFFQNFNNPFCRNTELAVNARRKSAEEVLNGHEFDMSALCKGVKKEIHSPNMIRILRFGQRQLNYCHFLVLARSVPLQVKASVDSVNPLVINMMNSSVAVKGVFKGDLPNHLSMSLSRCAFNEL